MSACCSCSPSSHARAKSSALAACEAYTNAGIGVPPHFMPTVQRSVAMRSALAHARDAAHRDSKWTALRDELVIMNAALQRSGYGPATLPAGQTNRTSIDQACELAGLKP